MNIFSSINTIKIKEKLILLLVGVGFLGLADSVSAQLMLPNPLSAGDINSLISNIATAIASIVGPIAVVMYIWAGILYLTSGVNPGNVQKANKAVLYATIGLGITLAAAGIVALVQWIISGP